MNELYSEDDELTVVNEISKLCENSNLTFEKLEAFFIRYQVNIIKIINHVYYAPFITYSYINKSTLLHILCSNINVTTAMIKLLLDIDYTIINYENQYKMTPR